MKILSLSNCPLIESQGSGYVIVNFCRELQSRGHDVDLFGPESYEPFQAFRKAKSYRQTLGMLFFSLEKLKEKKYDVIEFYGGESWLAASILSKLNKRNFLLVSHSNGLETYFYDTLIKYSEMGWMENPFPKWYQFKPNFWFQNAFTQVDSLVTVSEIEREQAVKYGYKDDLHVLGIDNPLPENYLNLNVDFKRNPIIGYCGSWIPRKGIKLIETDINQLLTDVPECSFKLIGVGESFRKEEHFDSEICSRIEVIPLVEDKQELQRIYQSISILIVPSFYESFGLVTAEAMACGCAVVASKVGFAASLKQGEEALLIEEPLSPLLYKSVKELLMNETLRLQVAQGGYRRVQNLRWDLAVERLETAYLGWLKEVRKAV